MVNGMVAELEPVPKAVAKTWLNLAIKRYGMRRVPKKKMTAIVPEIDCKSKFH